MNCSYVPVPTEQTKPKKKYNKSKKQISEPIFYIKFGLFHVTFE